MCLKNGFKTPCAQLYRLGLLLKHFLQLQFCPSPVRRRRLLREPLAVKPAALCVRVCACGGVCVCVGVCGCSVDEPNSKEESSKVFTFNM